MKESAGHERGLRSLFGDNGPDFSGIHLFRLRQDNRAVLSGKEYARDGVVGKEGVDFTARIGEKFHIVLMFPEVGRYLIFGFVTGDQEHADGRIVLINII